MGKEIRNRSIRFYLEKEEDRNAWEILHSEELGDFLSVNAFVVAAINDFYERNQRKREDPYMETREKEDAFAERIVQRIEEKVLSNLPALFGNFVWNGFGMAQEKMSEAGKRFGEAVNKENNAFTEEEYSQEPEENELLDMGAVFF